MSSPGPWGPPPPGIDLTKDQNASIISSVVIIMVIGLASVVLRWIARLSRTGPGLGLDDCFVVAAAVLGVGNAACCLISVHWGGGKHLWVVTAEQFTKLWQTTFAFVIVYINSITLTKTSILLYYRRIFGTSIIWWIVFAFTLAHGFEVTITWLAACRPISYFWRQYTDPTAVGKCINAPQFWFVNGIIGMLIDIAILIVPIPTVYKLKMPPKQKLFVCGILLLGSFVCVASIIRIVMMDKLVKAHDFTWAMCQVFIWSCLEPFIGILCACLPTYAPFVRQWYSEAKSQNSKQQNGYFASKDSRMSAQQWNRIHEGHSANDTGIRDSDSDVELATTVQIAAQGKNADQAMPSPQGEIVVTKGFSLHRSSSNRPG